MKKKRFVFLLSFFSLIILILLGGLSLLVSSPLKPLVIKEAGDEVSEFDFYKNPTLFQFLKKHGISLINIKLLTERGELAPDRIGSYPIQFLVNGRTESSLLKIKDSLAPELQIKEVIIPAGERVDEEDFILSLNDATVTKTRVKGLTNYQKNKKKGIYEIEIEAKDDAGNKTKKVTKLYSLPLKKKAVAELGDLNTKADIFRKKDKSMKFQLQFKEGFQFAPLMKRSGSYNLPVTVFMEGKKKNLELKLEVKDRTAPVFSGLTELNLLLGEDVSYRRGVNVRDNQAEDVVFKIDASKVNLKKEGSYQAIYSAEDKAGNKTEEKRRVNVLKAEKSHIKEVRAYVSETLKELLSEGMTEKERLKQIFDFCNRLRYVGSSEKNSVIEAAFLGFKTGTGDCFTYYSMASLLLTEAGFTEEMVEREGGDSRHYWNLVKTKNGWYHFDSCPVASADGFLPFMVSDEELDSFSVAYGKRFPDRKGYYSFNKNRHPERGKNYFD